jgi:CheY-like chemotaxis protein
VARILVIDDDEPFLKIVQMMLERAGHQVVVATSGMEGLREFKRSAVSLVLCDLYMPDMDGLDMLTALRKIKSDLPVIIMSGAPPKALGQSAAVDYLEMAELLGATSTIAKPFRANQLLARIDQALGR